jgi:hypothetical protein
MAFRKVNAAGDVGDSPDVFYNDVRGRKIPGLLAHQADILRNYKERALDKPDVAFQLPTGSGKTLVGLALAEWRRRKFRERVVYLCPTNQLVYQVAEQSRSKYGIPVQTFTGKAANYPAAAKAEYQNAETIAVTSYSALFNTNPFFNDPQLIILDDAHAAENYIADYWSLRILRTDEKHRPLFDAVVGTLRGFVSPMDYGRLTGTDDDLWSQVWVEKLPSPTLMELAPELTALIDAHVGETTLRFTWGVLRDHLTACHLYLSARQILIRPLIPPTDTHQPFASARQRLYMSATLGEGGDLERTTGRRNIVRLPIPPGWDQQGTGRRLFFLPERSLDSRQTRELVGAMISRAGRALYIVPSDAAAEPIRTWVTDHLQATVFDAKQIEESKREFVTTEHAVAVVANRYDGIDLAEDQCRLLILDGLPRAVNLQEGFLVHRMNSLVLLNDRVRTRVAQAFGRCTRSATDYSAVVVLGPELHDYLLTRERREAFHPDLRAELEFGIDQSKNQTPEGFLENLNILLAQNEEWFDADGNIVALRRGLAAPMIPGAEDLQRAAEHEVKYQYAIWNGNFEAALESARAVLTVLTAPELRGYRSLWAYLAGSAARSLALAGQPALTNFARTQFRAAAAGTPAVRWFAALAREVGEDEQVLPAREAGVSTVIERLEARLERLGTTQDRKFNEEDEFIRRGLASRDATEFERAHERLGRLLGYEAGNKETPGAPDPWWLVDESSGFIFEDHSDADPQSALNVTKARQAMSHPNWVRANLPVSQDAQITSVLISPVRKADRDALPHLGEVLYWNLDDFRNWAAEALTTVRELRRTFPGPGDVAWRDRAAGMYIEANLDPAGLLAKLRQSIAANQLQPAGAE